MDGECTVGFDRLGEDEQRWLKLRGLLVTLADMGVGEMICREYEITRDDLEMIAFIENEWRELRPKEPNRGGR